MQRNKIILWLLCASSTCIVGCSSVANVQCDQSSVCDLHPGGSCMAAPSGNKWCAYPDSSCPSGYRYGTFQTGDGVAGLCVAEQPDAGPPDGSTSVTPASCVGLPHTCGAFQNDDCCRSPMVAGGDYFRSYDVGSDGGASADKSFPATVSSFRLDKYEVTVGRFRAFVEGNLATQSNPPAGGAGAHPHIPSSGWQASWNQFLPVDKGGLLSSIKCNYGSSGINGMLDTWTDSVGPNENRPINCVTWYEAMAFCAWDGGYLPTEAEWNYAATGGSDQRPYPWSDPPSSVSVDSTRGSYNNGSGCFGDGNSSCTVADLLPVGSKPAGDGRWGQSDLFGNVDEWLLDWSAPYQTPCADCADLTQPNANPMRVIRGGSFGGSAVGSRSGDRTSDVPSDLVYNFGFRCARAP